MSLTGKVPSRWMRTNPRQAQSSQFKGAFYRSAPAWTPSRLKAEANGKRTTTGLAQDPAEYEGEAAVKLNERGWLFLGACTSAASAAVIVYAVLRALYGG
jgi:hypothetical protein